MKTSGAAIFFEVFMVRFFAVFGMLFTAAIWGFSFVVVKDSLNDVSAAYMIAIRFSIAALAVGLLFFRRLKKINVQYLKKDGLIGIFLFLAYLSQTIGCNYTTPGKNAFLTTFYVVLIPFVAWIVCRKRPEWPVFVAVLLQILGIGFLSLGDDVKSGLNFNFGDFLTLVCAVFFCLQMFFQSYFSKTSEENDPVVYAFIQFAVGAVLAWLVAPFYDAEKNILMVNFQPLSMVDFASKGFIMSALYLGLAGTAVAFVVQNIGLRFLNPALATILLSFESVFGMIFSILIPVNGVREKLGVCGIIGCIFIFAAVIIAQRQGD